MQVLDAQPVLLPEQLRLWQWVSDYYMSPLGDVMKAALPPSMKSEDGYRPRKETYIALSPNFRTQNAIVTRLKRLNKLLRTALHSWISGIKS